MSNGKLGREGYSFSPGPIYSFYCIADPLCERTGLYWTGVRPLNKAAALEHVEAQTSTSVVAAAQCSAIADSSAFPPLRPSSQALLSPPNLNWASSAGTPAAASEGAPAMPVPLPFLLRQSSA
ncbi:hypothetical protein T492DRAFT_414733 [Pavlovales sp. CCMP2436]|nr:hypothetical protein T492DRAFT_414733 [Pavlovales sp. CCMP2436]